MAHVGNGLPQRWVFAFGVYNDLRFISHRDTLRLFQRALARASLPVRFTEGFNPHPRLSIPFPLPVGMASDAEAIVIEFAQPIDGDAALADLRLQMPDGIRMIGARRLGARERVRPVLARYRLDADGQDVNVLTLAVRNVLASTTLAVDKVNPKTSETRTVDARPYLVDLRVIGRTVEFSLRVTPEGGVRPSEIAGLLGFEPGTINHRMLRLEVQWE